VPKTLEPNDLYALIREVPDFPQAGVNFKDLTPLLAHGEALSVATQALCGPFKTAEITAVVGIEARGFIFGSLVASALNTGFVPIRKAGKLPAATFSEDYSLEYGQDQLHIHRDALGVHDRVLLIDDVLATGGTAAASLRVIAQTGAQIIGCGFVINLTFLGGAERLSDIGTSIHSVLNFD
jgi:adenine phosphoribosyltransferase